MLAAITGKGWLSLAYRRVGRYDDDAGHWRYSGANGTKHQKEEASLWNASE
jgi:hypothetical protein